MQRAPRSEQDHDPGHRPPTNLALAARRQPDIVPLIRQVIYMGGAFDVPGNTTKTAKFNWWFDPKAAREVLRLPMRHVILPLDVTDTVRIDRPVYDRIVHGTAKDGIVAKLFKQLNGYGYDGKRGSLIVQRFDNPRFLEFYVDGLTRPVPVIRPGMGPAAVPGTP